MKTKLTDTLSRFSEASLSKNSKWNIIIVGTTNNYLQCSAGVYERALYVSKFGKENISRSFWAECLYQYEQIKYVF